MRKLFALIAAPAVALAMTACTAEQTEEGNMPDIEVEEGNLPEYDVDAADVDVGLDTIQVTVPDVNVNPPDTLPDTTGIR
ncbi:MAG: hypothetical protein WEB88_01855 [Gemmatimonadota bacterium]